MFFIKKNQKKKQTNSYKRSLKGQFLCLGFSISGSIAFALLVFAITMSKMNSAQQRYQNAVAIKSFISSIKTNYLTMEASEYGFIADPSNDGLWDEREKANKKLSDASTEIKQILNSKEHLDLIEKALDINKSILTPGAYEAKELITKNRMEVLKLYAMKISPGYDLAQSSLDKVVTKIEEQESLEKAASNNIVMLGSIILAVVLIFGAIFDILMIIKIGYSIVVPLPLAVHELEIEANGAKKAVDQINNASETLSRSAIQQASALEETASSIEELNAMTKKNADYANRSGIAANQSSESALRGKQAVDQMISAITEINNSNKEIIDRVEESNQQISEITRVINEIGNKTRIINDIVFQTKLLSFNASVEAARAGEHGKGFSVVAEEVGKLARMSGVAAKEITAMLDGGIRKVEEIVTQTRQGIEHLTIQTREKIQHGNQVANESRQIFDEIVGKVGEVNMMVKEISSATSEQGTGLLEISKAMSQVNQVMQQNTVVSNQVEELAKHLCNQSTSLGTVVASLDELMKGSNNNINTQQQQRAA